MTELPILGGGTKRDDRDEAIARLALSVAVLADKFEQLDPTIQFITASTRELLDRFGPIDTDHQFEVFDID